MSPVKHTPLCNLHRQLNARMTEFGGYEMPLSYAGIVKEHQAVRTAAGAFDLSHMGEFEVNGPSALALLERGLTNSAARLVDGQAQYTVMCTPDGGAIDDLIVYRLAPERYLMCVNASNIAADWEWLTELNERAELINRSEEIALIAIQGPKAADILAKMTDLPVAAIQRFRTARGIVADVECLVARTGYTGEDGFELFCPAVGAERLFTDTLETGAPYHLVPCGLGARDTLRMEASLPLYGHELDRSTSPLEAGLKSFVKFGRDFIGEAALIAQRDGAVRKRLAGIRTGDGRSIARQGYTVSQAGRAVGSITSGTFAPTFNRPLAMAYLDRIAEFSPGAAVEVTIRGRQIAAEITALPFYRRRAGNQPNPGSGG